MTTYYVIKIENGIAAAIMAVARRMNGNAVLRRGG